MSETMPNSPTTRARTWAERMRLEAAQIGAEPERVPWDATLREAYLSALQEVAEELEAFAADVERDARRNSQLPLPLGQERKGA